MHQVNVFNFRDGSRSHLALSCSWLQFFSFNFEIKVIVAKLQQQGFNFFYMTMHPC
jgi:hypothetical protein